MLLGRDVDESPGKVIRGPDTGQDVPQLGLTDYDIGFRHRPSLDFFAPYCSDHSGNDVRLQAQFDASEGVLHVNNYTVHRVPSLGTCLSIRQT